MYSIIGENFSWMMFNLLLAIIPVLFAWLFYKAQNTVIKVIFFAGWLFFVPNTIYVFTDILHFIEQINEVNLLGAVLLAAQYSVFFIAGFLTYFYSLSLIERKLKPPFFIIIVINFLIGLGVVLGRVYRLNSWDIILGTENVIDGLMQLSVSPKVILLAVLFGLSANFTYFLFRKKI